jgi:hypothetical protein
VIASLIVLGSIVSGVVFVLAWILRPEVRTWLERPKYRFQEDVRRYDREAVGSRQ